MISFILCLALLIIGYFTYGKVVDNTFGPDDRETPAVSINDGVDYVVTVSYTHLAVQIATQYGLNENASDVILGIILFFLIGAEFFINYRVKRTKK